MGDWYAPNQQAVRADESGPAEEGTGGTGADAGKSLDAMTKDELITEASARGVDIDASMTKAQIREALEA